MIDADGYRANVGMILCNDKGRLLWARRIGQDAWQFPQGGIRHNEEMEEALFRELGEEVGLGRDQVQVLGRTRDWLKYRLPEHLVRHDSQPVCYGQKQVWFLLMLNADENLIRLDASEKPEFDHWKWVDYWHPLKEVVSFKRAVYKKALKELKRYLVTGQKTTLSTSG